MHSNRLLRATVLSTLSAATCFLASCQFSTQASESASENMSCSDIAAAAQPTRAQTPMRHEDAPTAAIGASPATKTFAPGVGDTMTAIQLHHAKLWYAGDASNWRLVDYELAEIEESLQSVQETHPSIEGNAQPAAQSIAMFTAAPRMALRGAIAGKDQAGFREGFDALTAGCNTCHQTYGKDFVRIVRPTKPPVTNQDFVPR